MEKAWNSDTDLAKLSVNMMFGIWAMGHSQVVYHVKTSNDPDDGVGSWRTRYVDYNGGMTCDYMFATKL